MAYTPPLDVALRLSRGLIPGMTSVNKFGRNADVDIGTEDIWGTGGTWVQPTAATTVSFVSSSANDASAGTGARTLLIEGINGSYALTSETIALNGVTPVNTVNSYFLIHRVIVATGGSGATNYDAPIRITEKSIVKIIATSDTLNSDVCGNFNLILVAN